MTIFYFFKIINTKTFKNYFLIYLNGINKENLAANLEEFWLKNQYFNEEIVMRIRDFNDKGIKTVVVSASPTLFIKTACNLIGIMDVLGTELSLQDGKYKIEGENCRGKEKILRLSLFFGKDIEITAAFSDNKDDAALLKMSRESYWVKNGKLVKHESNK
jgi:phosphatidylglycerophosphatase C